MTHFWRENLAIFRDVKKKIEIYFSSNTFVSCICWHEGFFQEHNYNDGIKNIFHNIWRVFRMPKIKHSNINF